MGVEQAQLLAAMHRVEGVVYIQHDAFGHLAKGRAVEIDHGPAHAQQCAGIRQVLQPRDGGLRAQVALGRQALQSHLEQRVGAQAAGVVAVLVARRDGQKAEADDVGQRMHGAGGIARVLNAGGQTIGNPQPFRHLPQHQKSAIGGQAAAIKAPDHRLSSNG
jgi:hypothetical protein